MRLTILLVITIFCLLMTLIIGCAHAPRSNAPVCRISFDLSDDNLLSLNIQNKRAIKSFIEVCRK